MASATEYRAKAEALLKLAAETLIPSERAAFLELAARWHELAISAEASLPAPPEGKVIIPFPLDRSKT